ASGFRSVPRSRWRQAPWPAPDPPLLSREHQTVWDEQQAAWISPLQIFPEGAQGAGIVEAEGEVRRNAGAVVELRVGSKFPAPLRASPLFRSAHEGSPDTLPPQGWRHVPALEERHRAGAAILGIGAE